MSAPKEWKLTGKHDGVLDAEHLRDKTQRGVAQPRTSTSWSCRSGRSGRTLVSGVVIDMVAMGLLLRAHRVLSVSEVVVVVQEKAEGGRADVPVGCRTRRRRKVAPGPCPAQFRTNRLIAPARWTGHWHGTLEARCLTEPTSQESVDRQSQVSRAGQHDRCTVDRSLAEESPVVEAS